MQASPQRQAGERFVERDEHDDYGDSFDGQVHRGMRVRHKKFGIGVVQDVRPGSDPTLTVKFAGWPLKQIKLSFLEPA